MTTWQLVFLALFVLFIMLSIFAKRRMSELLYLVLAVLSLQLFTFDAMRSKPQQTMPVYEAPRTWYS